MGTLGVPGEQGHVAPVSAPRGSLGQGQVPERRHGRGTGKVSEQYFTETFHSTENLSEVQ